MVDDAASPKRGEVWWAVADKKRPVVVVQANFLNQSRIQWHLAVPLTSNLAREGGPGNVRLARRDTGLDRTSIANVSHLAPLPRSGFRDRMRPLSQEMMKQIDDGLRLVLSLQ